MKKILKNNSIIITALCIMIAIVWYLNYTDGENTKVVSNPNGILEGVSDEFDLTKNPLTENDLNLDQLLGMSGQSEAQDAEGSDFDDLGMEDLSDEDLAAMGETETNGVDAENTMNVSDNGEVYGEDNSTTTVPGEAVLASTTLNASYFASTKLTREQNRAREKETLMELMENEALNEEVKKDAAASYLAIKDIMERENATELLLEAKGFDGAVVSIIADSVDVIINAPTITEQQIAQIESIVKRKTGVEAQNIVINPVIVEE